MCGSGFPAAIDSVWAVPEIAAFFRPLRSVPRMESHSHELILEFCKLQVIIPDRLALPFSTSNLLHFAVFIMGAEVFGIGRDKLRNEFAVSLFGISGPK